MAIPTTIDTDTELSAVNSILGAIGQSPVTTLGAITEITGEVTYTGSNARAGTYTRSGTTVTVTSTGHGLIVGEAITIDFTSGGAADGDYTVITVPSADTFTITTTANGNISTSNLTISQSKFDIVTSFSTSSEIKASLDGVETTAFTISGNILTFASAPATDTSIRIWREKEVANTLANPEVSFIYNILTEVNKDVQNEAWVFNKEYNVKISPDSNKHISIPPNVLSYDLHRDDEKFDKNLVRRAGKLWDTIGQTYEFDDDVYLDIVWLWPFEDLPSAFKRYIISRASVRAATQLISNPQLVQLLQIQEAQTRATCLEYECQQGDHSFMGWPEKTSYTPYQPYVVLAR
jgi:hypothetical protein